MKKLTKFLVTLCVIVLVIFGILFFKGKGFTVGQCIIADNGSCLIVMDNSPVRLVDLSDEKDMMAGFKTGDKLLVIHDGVNETYPGNTGAYFCAKLSDGDPAAIPDKIIAELTELGWLSGN